MIALVLPLTAINGSSWAKFRKLIATRYTDITVVSITGADAELSFSSDTGIAECLVICRKATSNEKPSLRAQFVSLRNRPRGLAHALELVSTISSDPETRQLEDGPYGGIPLYSGNELAGEVLDAPIDTHETGWRVARVVDATIAQVAHSLAMGELWLPTEPEGHAIPITRLDQVGRRGLHHDLLVNPDHNGPFIKSPASPTASFPSLYNHSAQNEKYLVCNPDSALRVKPGMEEKAVEMWTTASRAHVNLDFRFTSQPLAAAFTLEKSIGGTAWPNVILFDERFELAFTLWCNSTLGLLSFWWHSNRQQSGRGRTTISSVGSLPVLDFRALTDEQLATAEDIFNEFRDKELKPAYLADADPNRALLDRRVVCDLLGFDEDVYEGVRRLSQKWCAEPSVHGAKEAPA